MRSSRLLTLLMLLQTRGRMTAQALAEIFEVSVRTVYRDVDQLSAAGVPVYADRGPGGGFALLDGYRTRLTGLNAAEAQTLILAGLPGPAAQLGLGEAAADAQMKVLTALSDGPGEAARRAQARIHLDPVGWFKDADDSPALRTLAEAAMADRRVSARYGPRRPVALVLEPLGVVLKAGVWYLVAGSRGEIRTYRVSQFLDVAPVEETFERPKGFDLAAHWAEAQQAYAAGLIQGVARLRASPEAQARLQREGGALTTLSDGTVELAIEGIDFAAGELLRFGLDVEVISPPELRARIAELAGAIAARHAI
ncbi:WYL domain-containing protein [Caulobacter sp. SLTY]|uniref:helix-turn-helix transcriptional regulator n=1 Tax=Caulobacter sp. SLTY TaxID=2683262 RepID=UPI001412A241|nr:WYL domain-containing protein [Caulobacter sp. SLTY]NBB15228.1 WYL domain-containing protein [Caulobacter sp. SLTY]